MSYAHQWDVLRSFHGPAAQKLILLAFGMLANHETGIAEVSIAGLARETGVDERWVRRFVRSVEGPPGGDTHIPGRWLYPVTDAAKSGQCGATWYRIIPPPRHGGEGAPRPPGGAGPDAPQGGATPPMGGVPRPPGGAGPDAPQGGVGLTTGGRGTPQPGGATPGKRHLEKSREASEEAPNGAFLKSPIGEHPRARLADAFRKADARGQPTADQEEDSQEKPAPSINEHHFHYRNTGD